MILPIYILRRGIKPGGDRMPKLVPLPKHIVTYPSSKWQPINLPPNRPCAVCKGQVGTYKVGSREALAGEFRGQEYFHTDCFKLSGGEARRKDKGNLPNEEYRFWVGYTHASGVGAICRACLHSAYGPQNRKDHLNDDKMAIEGARCAEQLSKAYTALLKDKVNCIVCHKERYGHEKWGVPLCSSPDCEFTWRFDRSKRYIMLENRLTLIRNGKTPLSQAKALTQLEQITAKKGGTLSGDFCKDCQMWWGDAAHAQYHAERELGEGFSHNVEKD